MALRGLILSTVKAGNLNWTMPRSGLDIADGVIRSNDHLLHLSKAKRNLIRVSELAA